MDCLCSYSLTQRIRVHLDSRVFSCLNSDMVLCLAGNITYLLHWDPSWPGYDWHLAYTISEWSLMIVFSLAVLTFFFDFKKIQVEEPTLQVTRYSSLLF